MDARSLIMQADEIRREKGLSSSEWGRIAGLDSVGVAVGRTYSRGNCKLSTMISLLAPLGYELRLVKTED